MDYAFYAAMVALILAVALINWMAKAPPERISPQWRWGLMVGGALVSALAILAIVVSVESGSG